jgi:ferrochelatase
MAISCTSLNFLYPQRLILRIFLHMVNKIGIILMNLGSPDSTGVKDVRAYLMQFLMDKRVIDYPYLSRKLLVGALIVPARAPKSAAAYKTIWTKQGSPLIVLTRQLKEALQELIAEPVEMAMRYGNPSVDDGYHNIIRRMPDAEEVLAIPLYPHYAMSSYETAIEYAREIHKKNKYRFRLRFMKPFYNDMNYIEALSENIRPYLQQDYDHILFSYHGLPARHIRKTDPTKNHCLQANDCCQSLSAAHATCYRHQVFATTGLVAEKLGIPAHKFSLSFQSRLGKGWLEPFTDLRLEEMPKQNIKKLVIVCPAFVSDCLETLEEIVVRGRKSFMNAGGESYTVVPCLNTGPLWVKTIARWINEYATGETGMLLSL